MAMFDSESIVLLVFIILAITAFNSGGWSTDNPLVWAPAMILQIPLAIFGAIANSMPLFAPLALVALLAYLNFMNVSLGEPFMALVIFTSIIVLLGV